MMVLYIVVAVVVAALTLNALSRRRTDDLRQTGFLPPPGQGSDADVERLVALGRKIDAIKLYREIRDSLVRGGRFVFSVFHPEMAAAGIEANFEQDGVEYRLGALRHTVADYLNLIDRAGFRRIEVQEFRGDDVLVEEVPWASKYLGRPLLLAVEARTS